MDISFCCILTVTATMHFHCSSSNVAAAFARLFSRSSSSSSRLSRPMPFAPATVEHDANYELELPSPTFASPPSSTGSSFSGVPGSGAYYTPLSSTGQSALDEQHVTPRNSNESVPPPYEPAGGYVIFTSVDKLTTLVLWQRPALHCSSLC